MKKFKLIKSDVYDLASVLATVIREQSEKLDFKEVIGIQKSVNYFLGEIKDFADSFEEITKERNGYIEIANKKIEAFKQTLQKGAESDGKIDEEYKAKLDVFVEMSLESTKAQIATEINPQMEALYLEIGKTEVEFELEDTKHKMVIDAFEKYAKEKYNDKKKMVLVYEILTA